MEVAAEMAALKGERLTPEELVARKQALLAALPRPTPVPREKSPPEVAEARPDRTNLSERERLLVEFGEAMGQASQAEGTPKQIVARKAELLRLNADTVKWARTVERDLPERTDPPRAWQKPLGEMPLRQQLAAMIAEIWKRKASPKERIADIAKFRRDNAEAFEAVKRNPNEPSALITK